MLVRRSTIRGYFTLVLGLALAVMIGTNVYLGLKVVDNTARLDAEKTYIEVLRAANAANTSFGHLRYWLTDLALSLLNESERRAKQARQDLEKQLDILKAFDPSAVAEIRRELEGMVTAALEAVDAYTDEQRIRGNAIMAQSRTHIRAIETTLASLTTKYENSAQQARDETRAAAQAAIVIAWSVGAAGAILVVVVSVGMLGSLGRRLRALMQAIDELSAGRIDAEMPQAGSDEIGAMSATLGMFRDSLIERQKLERAVTAKNTKLAELVKSLEVARDQAHQASAAKTAFLANMSHELRTPLNAIIGYSQMLAEEMEETGDKTAITDLTKIENAGKHLLGLINDILDLSKIEAGRMDLYPEDVDLHALIGEVRTLVEPLMAKNANKLVVSERAGLGIARSDLTKLKQCLLNLLSNASKFTHAGTVTLEAERYAEGGQEWLRFTVADTGIGMSERQLSRLFLAFSQADETTTRKYGGTGLGLVITRHFARMMSGDVTVTSTVDKGSRFTIAIPARLGKAGAEQAPAATVPVVTGDPNASATVLVVDDDPAAHDLIGSLLVKEGYRVLHAQNGEDALRLARDERPDAITLDVMMPRMDGWSVLTAIKGDPELCETPVVIVSILHEKGTGFALGADGFLTKPIDRASLAQLVRKLMVSRSGPGGTILVVEDDDDTRAMTCRLVEQMGFAARQAPNGREAIEWLKNNPVPALVLLDLIMPEMDGFEFLNAIQNAPRLTQMPVVVITAKDLSQADRDILAKRASQIVVKGPIPGQEVAAAVNAVVSRARAPARAASGS